MNSLILTLDAGAGCCLPIAYQQLTQGRCTLPGAGAIPSCTTRALPGTGRPSACSLLVRWRALPRAGQ
ncbi:hypothetical protein NIA69_02635 [Gemmiger formicilis]|nr:hypothetical protein [Gemmiger formicilis]